ncbi:MAG TPA: ZIP family metal transporter [bacterium]|nr:ZIP family metal transporter [bacterium]
MEGSFFMVMAATCTACVITTTGIYVINRFADWGRKNAIYFIAFAAGVLITVSFLRVIPKSFQMNSFAPIYLLAGFMFFHVLSRYLNVFMCKGENCGHNRGLNRVFGIIPAIGIGFHSFVDGMIYAVTFKVNAFMGAVTSIGMIFHEFPEGIVTFLFLVKSGFDTKKAVLYAFLIAAITTPLGAFVSWPFLGSISDSTLGILLSISAGALVYVGTTHLLPEVEEDHKKFSLLALAAGILVAVIIILTK